MATYSGIKKIKIGDNIFQLYDSGNSGGTVTKVSTGAGLTGGDITTTGTIKAKLNSETSLGTIGTTDKLYAVGVDANGKLCINVPWTDSTVSTLTLASGSTAGTSLTSGGKFTLTVGTKTVSFTMPTIPTNTDEKVKQTNTTTSSAYEILFSYTADNTERIEGARKTSTLTYNPSTKALSTGGTVNGLTLTAATTGFTIAGGTTSKTLTVSNTYTLGAACAKGVTDNSSSTAVTSTDTNLITGRTLYYAGYTKNSGTVTQVTAGTGLSIGTTAGGNFTTSGTINHTNSVTAQTTQAVYPIKIDAQGHISAYGTAVTIPTMPTYTVSNGLLTIG